MNSKSNADDPATAQELADLKEQISRLTETKEQLAAVLEAQRQESAELQELIASMENASAQAIEAIGAGQSDVLKRDQAGHVVAVNLTSRGKRDDLQYLSGLLFLTELRIPLPDVNDESLKIILPLKRLRLLDLEGSAVRDAGVELLKQLPALEDIGLKRTSITDEAFGHLSQFPKLTRIRAAQTAVTDAGLEKLKDQQGLELLDFRDCNQITDAGLAHLTGLANLKDLKIWGPGITDAGLDYLQGLKRLKVLSLQDTGITDAGLSKLEALTNLETLGLMRCFVTSEGTPSLAKLTKLRRLDLRGTLVNEAGMANLTALKELRDLDLSESIVADAGLEPLAKLPKLEDLNLWGTRVGDEGMRHVAEIKTLKHLNLDRVGWPSENIVLTDEGVKQLVGLENLVSLHLGQAQIGAAAMESLAGLKKLRELKIPFCENVTDEDVAKLTAALPDLKVTR